MTGQREGGASDGLTLENLGEFVTAPELAKATGLKVQTIRAAINRGELAAFIPGSRDRRSPGRGMGYRIRKTDAAAWFFGAARGGE